MDFRDYTYIQAIAQCKSITKAAEMLYISQPSLSKFLQKLEEKIGTPLFERINKQMYPTYAGELFLKTGQDIFQLQGQLDIALEHIVQKSLGRIRLSTTITRGYYVLPNVLPNFKKMYPDYHIEIQERSIDEVEQNLRNGVTDLAIYVLSERNPEFQYFHINSEEIVLCLKHNSPYVQYAQFKEGFKFPWIDVAHLSKETFFISEPAQYQLGRMTMQILREAAINPEITEIRYLETCLSLASGGLGVAFTFDIGTKHFKNYKHPPIYLSVGKQPYSVEFVVACRKGYKLQQAELDFLNLLRSKFGPYA